MSALYSSRELFAEAGRLAARASFYRALGMFASADVLADRAARLESRAWAAAAREAEGVCAGPCDRSPVGRVGLGLPEA